MRMPSRQARADWIDRWSKTVSAAMLAEIKAGLVAKFNEKKKEQAA